MRGQQTCPLTKHFHMWTVSSEVRVQRRHWQPLSVHLWAYCTHPTHDVNDVMSEGWPQHRGLRPLLFSNSGVGSFTSQKNQISVSAVRWDPRFFVLIREGYKVSPFADVITKATLASQLNDRMNVTNEFYDKSERFSTLKQESPKGDFHWATKFPGGEGGCTHSGHQACRWPLRNIASHLNIVPFWETFVTKKMSTIFKSGLYSTFSNSTITTNEQVSHCQQETRSVIFTHPSPNPSAPPAPPNIVWPIWPNW